MPKLTQKDQEYLRQMGKEAPKEPDHEDMIEAKIAAENRKKDPTLAACVDQFREVFPGAQLVNVVEITDTLADERRKQVLRAQADYFRKANAQ